MYGSAPAADMDPLGAAADEARRRDLEAYMSYNFKLPRRGKRINCLAIVLAYIIPCIIFTSVVAAASTKLRYNHPALSFVIVIVCLCVVLYYGSLALQASREKGMRLTHTPTWYIFVFLTSLLAFLLGLLAGLFIYQKYMLHVFDTAQLSVYGMDVDDGGAGNRIMEAAVNDMLRKRMAGAHNAQNAGNASQLGRFAGWNASGYPSAIGPDSPIFGRGGVNPSGAKGRVGTQMMDAGIIYFAFGTYVDLSKAMSFGENPTYCVAPITLGVMQPEVLDFFAVGIDCCYRQTTLDAQGNEMPPAAGAPPVFNCGQIDNPMARAGLRDLDDEDRAFYKLAVDKAGATYGFQTIHPLFFHWMQDPINGNVYKLPPDLAVQKGMVTNGGFLGLWPFTWSDFGLGFVADLGLSSPWRAVRSSHSDGAAGGWGSGGGGSGSSGSNSVGGSGGSSSSYGEGGSAYGSKESIGTSKKTAKRVATKLGMGFYILQAILVTCAASAFASMGYNKWDQ